MPVGESCLLLSCRHYRFASQMLSHGLVDAHETRDSLPSCSKSALHVLNYIRLISWRVAPRLLRISNAYAMAVWFLPEKCPSDLRQIQFWLRGCSWGRNYQSWRSTCGLCWLWHNFQLLLRFHKFLLETHRVLTCFRWNIKLPNTKTRRLYQSWNLR